MESTKDKEIKALQNQIKYPATYNPRADKPEPKKQTLLDCIYKTGCAKSAPSWVIGLISGYSEYLEQEGKC